MALRFVGMLFACLLGASAASAQIAQLNWASSEEPHEPAPAPAPAPVPRHAIEGALAYYQEDDEVSSLQLLLVELSGRYVLDARWAISGHIGLAGLSSAPRRQDADLALRPSNPELILWYTPPLEEPALRLRAGLGLAGPLTWIERGENARLHRTALSNAAALDGLRRMWRWTPSRTTVIAALELDYDADRELTLKVEAWPALLIPSRDEFLYETLDFVVPLTVAAEAHVGILHAGPRLHAVFIPTRTLDQAQFSVEPFVALRSSGERVLFGELSITLNIDEPLAGPRGPDVWGLHLRGGGEL